MTLDPQCAAYGALVSWGVDLLRRVPWLAKYPQLLAFVLSAVAVLVAGHRLGDLGPLVLCVLQAYAGSVVTHETVSRWTGIGRTLSGGASKDA